MPNCLLHTCSKQMLKLWRNFASTKSTAKSNYSSDISQQLITKNQCKNMVKVLTQCGNS